MTTINRKSGLCYNITFYYLCFWNSAILLIGENTFADSVDLQQGYIFKDILVDKIDAPSKLARNSKFILSQTAYHILMIIFSIVG